MYPEPDTRQFSYAPLDTVMEGAFRPGHFNGVCQIVSKLFEAVKPHRAYFGEKDFQQLAIIREMVRQMQFDLEIVGCPIVREEDGLALSSRNARLSAEERENALKISQTLFKSRTFAATHTVGETLKFVEDAIAAVPGLRLEYFEIVDGNTLQKVDNWNQTSYVVGCITVFCGDVRLIDNIKYKEIIYEDCNNNIQFIKEMFLKIGLMVKEELMWNISNFDSVPVNSEDYSGVGRTVNDSRQRVYLFQQRILNEHTVVIGHKELLNLFGDIRTIYEAVFVATIDGCQSEISIFDGDIISIQGNIEDFL